VIAYVEVEFGKTADLPVKLRIAAAGIKKHDAGMRRDFNVAIGAEVERLRDGVIRTRWGRGKHSLSGSLTSQSAETMRSGVAALLSKPVRTVLASSSVIPERDYVAGTFSTDFINFPADFQRP